MKNPAADRPGAVRWPLRLLLAAAFALLFVLLLALLPALGLLAARPQLAFAEVQAWLLDDGVDAPLRAALLRDRLPALAVLLRTSPPLADAEQQRAISEYAGLADRWARARAARGEPVAVDATLPRLQLVVHVGDFGLRAELFAGDGGIVMLRGGGTPRPAVRDCFFWRRCQLWPWCLPIVIALAALRRPVPLLLAVAAGLAVAVLLLRAV